MSFCYSKPLYIQPFDHRGSSQTKLFAWKGQLTEEQTAEIAGSKQVIYDGFKAAISAGVPEEKDKKAYDVELRPALMVRAIEELQDAGVEADVWKVEGLDRRKDSRGIARCYQTFVDDFEIAKGYK